MDHREIQERHLIERYVAGQLSEEEAAGFEEHLLDCPVCFEEVQAEEEFREAIRVAGAEDQARAVAVPVGLLAWVAHRSRTQQWGMLLVACLLAALLPAWLLWEQGQLRRELAVAQAAAAEAREQIGETRPTPGMPTDEVPQDQERRQLEAELNRQRETAARLEEEIRRLSRPQAAALVSLGLVRGDSPAAMQIRLDPDQGGTLLSVELPAAEYTAYRATLIDSGGKVVWQGDRLEPSLYETLLIHLPPGFLKPGSYRLLLDGLDERERTAAGEISFEVLPPA